MQTVGSAVAFTATGTFSDGSTQNLTTSVTWSSGNSAIASLGALSTTQAVNCIAAGTSVVSATLSSIAGTTTLTCTVAVTLASLAVTPGNPTQASGSAVAFTATGTYSDGSTQNLTSSSNWWSSNAAVATLGAWGNASLVVTCAGVGTSTIQATNGSISGSTALTCTTAAATAGENAYCTSNNDASCFATAQTDGPASLPQSGIYTGTDGTPANGPVVTVSCGSNCTTAAQAALNAAVCGERIVTPAINGGIQTVLGAISLPAHSCDANHWIWVESDQTMATGFPAEHARATPCSIGQATVPNYPSYPCSSAAMLMPQIQCTGGAGCITVAAGANFYRLIGLEIHGAPAGSSSLSTIVDLSGGSDHIIFDRDLVHGVAMNCAQTAGVYTCTSQDVAHGIATTNSTNVAVINSWIYDLLCPQATCVDATGIGLGGNGATNESGKKIFNNLIAAAGEDYFAGGGGMGGGSTTLTPSDFEIRSNHLFKPVTWALCNDCSGQHPEFKNDGELKNANRVLIEGNVFENSWSGWQTDQMGFLALLTPKNQSSTMGGNASSDGVGSLTATGGTFPATVTSSLCGNPGHCTVKYNNSAYLCQAQNYVDPTHISLMNCTPSVPPVTGNANYTACTPGLNAAAHTTNVTMRFNDFRNGKNGVEFAAATSDCNDSSQGISAVSMHDNLFQGINALLSNARSPGTGEQCLEIFNGQTAPNNIYNFLYEHNTCAIGYFGYAYAFAGLDYALDATDTTGSGGSYMANRIERNNLGVAGGLAGYNQGGLYPNGLNYAIGMQSCTPPGGSTCTWTYTKNVEGVGLWSHQNDGRPYPPSNADPGDSPAGAGCGASGATCHPSGSAFTSLFVSYNGANGQTGYLGNYQLASGSPYSGAGTDGKDIGISDWTSFNSLTSGVRSNTTYTAASITTYSLPAAMLNAAYSQALAASSASDFQAWQVISGALPAGLSLSLGGVISGSPTATGTSTFTVQMMDAAQQYATQTLSLTVTSGTASANANWQLVSTPSSATQVSYFAVNSSNHWFLSDRNTGFWKSTNQGASWTQINGTIPAPVQGWTIQVNPATGDLIANTINASYPSGGASHYYRSTDEGNTWTQVPEPTNFHNSWGSAQTGCLLPTSGGGNLVCGGYYGGNNTSGFYSTNNGTTTTLTSATPAVSSDYGFARNPVDGSFFMGTENGGTFRSTDGGATWTQVWPFQTSPSNGNQYFVTFDCSGNPIVTAQAGIFRGVGSAGSYTWTNPLFNGNTSAGKGLFTDSYCSIYWGHNHDTNRPTVVYRSLDNGVTWSAWDTGIPAGLEGHVMVENPADGMIYAVIEDGQTNNGWVYRTSK